jgi:chemotaxis protein MotB
MKLHQHIRREQARHTDDWLITYADTVTLLLCLFVIMLSIKANSHSLARDQAAPVQQLAASEDIVPRTCIAPEAGEAVGATSPDFVSPIPAFEEAPPDSVIAVPTPMPDAPGRLDAAVAAPTNLMEGTPLRGSGLASLPAIVDRLQSQGTPAVAQQGDRITILQISSAAFFGSGYAALSGAGKAILRDVAVTLKSDAYAGYNISIEGHTDDAPINTAQFQSNWELSTARAAAVVRFFLEQGIPARKLTAAGYADTFPVAPNRTSDGTVIPENQAGNRRVVIKLEKIDKAER